MAIKELKEALILLRRMPLLWTTGIVGGFLAASLFLTLNFYGTFFAGRLLIISGLVLLIFTTGMLTLIRDNEGDLRALLAGGTRYYFRILLPQVVIGSVVILFFILLMVTFSFFGISDISIVTALTFGFMIPTIIVTFFYDTAAIFEDRHVFDSIKHSIQLVFTHMNEVIIFLFVYAVIIAGIFFLSIIVWSFILSIFLYDKLKPMSLNETQLQTFTPDQFIALIGPGGIWITGVILFLALFLLLPVLYTYKACFYKKLANGTAKGTIITQQPTTGEYDSKGRWYKY
jgi:hypothetical protein